jgi:hypothetical protein
MSRRSEEKELRKAAQRGDMNAAYDLGGMLEEEAEPWLQKAAASNDPEPQINRHNAGVLEACLLELGRLDEAEQYLVMAADSGHRLGSSVCTLTRTRLIIDDARGGSADSATRYQRSEHPRANGIAEDAANHGRRRRLRHLLCEQGPKVPA